MNIKDLYEKYQIMPGLAEHQLRVAGIAKLITNNWEDRKTANKCVKACLVHDMGNIVKFNDKIGQEWIKVREEFKKKYGSDTHQVTCRILREIGLEEYAGYMEEEAKMYKKASLSRKDFEAASKPCMILIYADLRVVPTGVVSLEERITDLENRYGKPRSERQWDKILHEYIQSLTEVKIEGIKESDVTPLFNELLTVEI